MRNLTVTSFVPALALERAVASQCWHRPCITDFMAIRSGPERGGASIVSAWATARIYAWRVDATLLAGGTLIAWTAIEWALVSSFSWLQIWYGVLGVVLLALGILQSENLRQRWVVRVTLAESIGYLAPTLAGVFSVRWSTDQRPPAWVLIAAGCLEGLCLGYGQASALPWKVSRWRYSMLTGIAAGGVTAGSWFALVGA